MTVGFGAACAFAFASGAVDAVEGATTVGALDEVAGAGAVALSSLDALEDSALSSLGVDVTADSELGALCCLAAAAVDDAD